jgi:hypothetical protein
MSATDRDKSQLQGSSVALRKSNFEVAQSNNGGADFFTYETLNAQ